MIKNRKRSSHSSDPRITPNSSSPSSRGSSSFHDSPQPGTSSFRDDPQPEIFSSCIIDTTPMDIASATILQEITDNEEVCGICQEVRNDLEVVYCIKMLHFIHQRCYDVWDKSFLTNPDLDIRKRGKCLFCIKDPIGVKSSAIKSLHVREMRTMIRKLCPFYIICEKKRESCPFPCKTTEKVLHCYLRRYVKEDTTEEEANQIISEKFYKNHGLRCQTQFDLIKLIKDAKLEWGKIIKITERKTLSGDNF